MNFDEFKQLTESKKKINPIWFALEADKLPTAADIHAVESKLGVKMPMDYINFVTEYGGGYFAFSNVFSLCKNSEWNILEQNASYNSIPHSHVLISANGSGDFYGYKIESGQCLSAICFFDHESQTWSETDFANIYEYLAKYALTN